MKIQNNQLKKASQPKISSNQRLQEVAKILAAGIIRLSIRERQNPPRLINHFPLDHKNFPSTHSNNINSINQVSHIYE